ncbi:MAG TPA: hypothetical protein VI298_08630 [Geobacteraceae bacterium]
MRGYEAAVFQKAFQIAMAEVAPQGASFETLRDRLNAGTRTKRKGDYSAQEWARDVLNCLPDDPEAQRLLMVHYLPVYVCRCNALQVETGRCDDCGEFREPYRMSQTEAGKCGGSIRHFWARVQERRLFGVGLRLVER